MKTYRHLYDKLCSYGNLYLAYKKARKGKTKKSYVVRFERNFKQSLLDIQHELINKTYKPKPLKKFIIRDPKTRKICKSAFKDRIVHHTVVNILEPIYEKIFIYDSYASRKGKGQHKALQRFDYFKRKTSKNGKKLKGINDNNYICGYVLKADIRHYFDNVDHQVLIKILRGKIKDENFLLLIRQILNNHLGNIKCRGMPLGNYTSQFFANVYLNELDYFIKHNLRAKYYFRYVDDLIVLHNSKSQLKIWKEEINKYVCNKLKLNLHPDKSRIIPLNKGIPLLGFRVFYHYKLLKKSNVRQIKKRVSEWNGLYGDCEHVSEKLSARIEGWLVHAQHGNTFRLRKKILNEFENLYLDR